PWIEAVPIRGAAVALLVFQPAQQVEPIVEPAYLRPVEPVPYPRAAIERVHRRILRDRAIVEGTLLPVTPQVVLIAHHCHPVFISDRGKLVAISVSVLPHFPGRTGERLPVPIGVIAIARGVIVVVTSQFLLRLQQVIILIGVIDRGIPVPNLRDPRSREVGSALRRREIIVPVKAGLPVAIIVDECLHVPSLVRLPA